MLPLVHLEAVELIRLRLPLVTPFRTSYGVETARDVLLVHALGSEAEGWGECVAGSEPTYTAEHIEGAHLVIREHLLPRLLVDPDHTAAGLGRAIAPIKGHPIAKAALEAAILDAELRAAGVSLATHLGGVRVRVEAGVSVGIEPSVPALVDRVRAHVAEGYRRIKLKVEPGWDVEPVAAVRDAIGDVPLQVDANSAYSLADREHLAQLDAFDLLLIEQPLAAEDLLGHAELARTLRTPICLDESIESVHDAALAIHLGAAAIVNIKPARVGGYLEAVRIHDLCVEHEVPVWCGGMLETGIGRAGNVALASLPGFTLPGDTSASARYFERDLTEPFVLEDGCLRVPTGPGLGVALDEAFIRELATSREVVRR
jgi:O-succinylbenzoate synthase